MSTITTTPPPTASFGTHREIRVGRQRTEILSLQFSRSRPSDQARLRAGHLPKNIWTFQFGNKRSQKSLEISSHRKLEWGVILFLLCIGLKILVFHVYLTTAITLCTHFKIETKAHLDPTSEWRPEGVWPRWPDSRSIAPLVNPVSLLGQPNHQSAGMKAKKRGWS